MRVSYHFPQLKWERPKFRLLFVQLSGQTQIFKAKNEKIDILRPQPYI